MTERITLTPEEAAMYGDPPADEPEYDAQPIDEEPADPPSDNGEGKAKNPKRKKMATILDRALAVRLAAARVCYA